MVIIIMRVRAGCCRLARHHGHHSISLARVRPVPLGSAEFKLDKRQLGSSRSLFNLILSTMGMGSTGRFLRDCSLDSVTLVEATMVASGLSMLGRTPGFFVVQFWAPTRPEGRFQ